MESKLEALLSSIAHAFDEQTYTFSDSEYLVKKTLVSFIESQNALTASARHIPVDVVETVLSSVISRNFEKDPYEWLTDAAVEVYEFTQLAYRNEATKDSMQYANFLPIGHPRAYRVVPITAAAHRNALAEWIAADPSLNDASRSAVLAFYSSENSDLVSIEFSNLRLEALTAAGAASPEVLPLVAAFNMSRAKRSAMSKILAAIRRRDRLGQFANEFGRLKGYFSGPDGVFSAISRIVGRGRRPNTSLVEFDGSNPQIPAGLYEQENGKSENVEAYLSADAVKGIDTAKRYVSPADAKDAVPLADFLATRRETPDGWSKVGAQNTSVASFKSNDGKYFVQNTNSLDAYNLASKNEDSLIVSGLGKGDSIDPEAPNAFLIRDARTSEVMGIAQDWAGIEDVRLFADDTSPGMEKIGITYDPPSGDKFVPDNGFLPDAAPGTRPRPMPQIIPDGRRPKPWDMDNADAWDMEERGPNDYYREDLDETKYNITKMSDGTWAMETLFSDGKVSNDSFENLNSALAEMGKRSGIEPDRLVTMTEQEGFSYENSEGSVDVYLDEDAKWVVEPNYQTLLDENGPEAGITDPIKFDNKEQALAEAEEFAKKLKNNPGALYDEVAARENDFQAPEDQGLVPDIDTNALSPYYLGEGYNFSKIDENTWETSATGPNGEQYQVSQGSNDSWTVEELSGNGPDNFDSREIGTFDNPADAFEAANNESNGGDFDAAWVEELLADTPEGDVSANQEVRELSPAQAAPASGRQYALLQEILDEKDLDPATAQGLRDALDSRNLNVAQAGAFIGLGRGADFKEGVDPTIPSDRMLNSLQEYLQTKDLAPSEVQSALDSLESDSSRANVEKLLSKLRSKKDRSDSGDISLNQDAPSVDTGKRGEPATDAQYNFLKSLFDTRQINDPGLQDAIKSALDEKILTKGQIGALLGELRTLPEKAGVRRQPTEKQVASIKRGVLERGLPKAEADEILNSIDGMSFDDASSILNDLKRRDITPEGMDNLLGKLTEDGDIGALNYLLTKPEYSDYFDDINSKLADLGEGDLSLKQDLPRLQGPLYLPAGSFGLIRGVAARKLAELRADSNASEEEIDFITRLYYSAHFAINNRTRRWSTPWESDFDVRQFTYNDAAKIKELLVEFQNSGDPKATSAIGPMGPSSEDARRKEAYTTLLEDLDYLAEGRTRPLPVRLPTDKQKASIARGTIERGLPPEESTEILAKLDTMSFDEASVILGNLKSRPITPDGMAQLIDSLGEKNEVEVLGYLLTKPEYSDYFDDINSKLADLGEGDLSVKQDAPPLIINARTKSVEELGKILDDEDGFNTADELNTYVDEFNSTLYVGTASEMSAAVYSMSEFTKNPETAEKLRQLSRDLDKDLESRFGSAEAARVDGDEIIDLSDVDEAVSDERSIYFETDPLEIADRLDQDDSYGDARSNGAEARVTEEEDGTTVVTVTYDRGEEVFKSEDRDEAIAQGAAAVADYNTDVIPSAYRSAGDLESSAANASTDDEALAVADTAESLADALEGNRGSTQVARDLRAYAERIRDMVAKSQDLSLKKA